MNAKTVNAAADVICRAMENGRQTPTGWAMALDTVCMLQSPESAAELEAYRALELGTPKGRVSAKCEDATHPVWLRELDDVRGCPWCRIAELEQQLAAKDRSVDEDPTAFTLTPEAEAAVDRLTRALASAYDPREDELAEDTADILTLAPAQHADAKYNATFQTIELELTATQRHWSEWLHALDIDLARTTNRGSYVTSHASWRGTHVAIRCWFAPAEDAAREPVEDPHDSPLRHDYRVGRDLPEVQP